MDSFLAQMQHFTRRDDYHLVDLLDEYDFPAPFPEDMFDVLDFQTDQAYLMLATTKSGVIC